MSTRGEIVKYLFLGGVNFLLTLLVFQVLLENLGLHYILALFLSWFVGMVFMYVTNFLWVFRGQGTLRFDVRLVRFFLVGLVSITFNMLILALVVRTYATDPFWTQILFLPVIVTFNFLATKYFSLALDGKSVHDRARQKQVR